ncbi:GrpB family protein [Gorillibacterium sp. CAU 1737]|uniref:GrpB family protein n=1 Tax=Gorillibacterium sp. CAU 1737 TaxID=3140362 RepID=UPI003260DA12
MLGIPKGTVNLVPYSAEWSSLFQLEKERIIANTSVPFVDIQHVGSTSIIGIPTKPVIDLVAAVGDFVEGYDFIRDAEAIGYYFKGSLGKSNRFFFWREIDNKNTHNLHIVKYGDENWLNLTLFRDYCNQNLECREQYSKMKVELAQEHANNRNLYTEKKSQFIREVIRLAKQETRGD